MKEEEQEPLFFQAEDARSAMISSLRDGEAEGITTHIPVIDSVFRFRKTEFTIVTGYSNQGKSQMLNYLTLIKALQDGWKIASYSPENLPPHYFFSEPAATMIGKSPVKGGRFPMSVSEYQHAISIINDKFYLINMKQKEATIEAILERFKQIHEMVGLDCCIIDPYLKVNMGNMEGAREDLKAGHITGMITEFCRNLGVSVFMVMHLVSPQISQQTGNYEVPTLFKLRGGSAYSDGADNVISIYRPKMPTDYKDQSLVFSSLKIKRQRLVAVPGSVSMMYNRDTFNYTDQYGTNLFNFSKFIEPVDNALF